MQAMAGLIGAMVLGWGFVTGTWAAETPKTLEGVKVVTAEDVASRYSREERLAPMRHLLRSLLENQRGTTSSSFSAPLHACGQSSF